MSLVFEYSLKENLIKYYAYGDSYKATHHPDDLTAVAGTSSDQVTINSVDLSGAIALDHHWSDFVDASNSPLGSNRDTTIDALNNLFAESWFKKGYPVDDGGVTKRIKVVGGIINIGLS